MQDADPHDLAGRYGATGLWLHRMANAQDSRAVDPGGEMKTISSETTFNSDLSRLAELESVLWRQAERVSARAKSYGLAGTHHGAEAEDRRFPAAHPLRLAGRAHPAGRPHLPHRAGRPEARGRRHPLPPAGRGAVQPGAGRRAPIPPA